MMATPASQLIQDQNINFHCDGAAFGMNTNNISKAQTKGRLGARRALNDISNSTKPSAPQASKKTSSSVGTDFDDPKTKFSTGGKVYTSKPQEKKQAGGRKALGDLTNSCKPSVHTTSYDEKISVVAEEGFLHNHLKCIKEQRNAMDLGCFLKDVGISNASAMPGFLTPHAYPPSKMSKLKRTPVRDLEMEELPELQIPFYKSPVCESPMSPKALCMMNWKDDSFPSFSLIETPMLLPKEESLMPAD